MLSWILYGLRRTRSRLSGWSAGEDRQFHDDLFARSGHDPFSAGYPGYITIRRFADLAAEHLAGARAVLDLGCGPGEITCELGRRFPGIRFHGVDHSEVAVQRASSHAARLNLPHVTFERADLATFEPPGRVDVVLMFDAFHHLVEPAAFVNRLSRVCDRFFLIEPSGDAIGRWTRTIDFDWLPAELDKIRARTEHLLVERGNKNAQPQPASREPGRGRAVEHRYPLADYESFFNGFQVSVKGTVAGLDVYPPEPEYESPWRTTAMETAYTLLKQVDERLADQGLDLSAKHWAIYASRGEAHARTVTRSRAPALDPWTGAIVQGPHDVRYEQPDFPQTFVRDSEVRGEVTICNDGWRTLRSDLDEHPVHVSYRWCDARRRGVTHEGLRSSLPRPLEPGGSCRAAVRVRAPSEPGVYFLELDLVEEGVTWFSEAGVPPLRLRIRVLRT